MKRILFYTLAILLTNHYGAQTIESVARLDQGFAYEDFHDNGYYTIKNHTEPFLLDPDDPGSMHTPSPNSMVIRHYTTDGVIDWQSMNENMNSTNRQLYPQGIVAVDDGFLVHYNTYLPAAVDISMNPGSSTVIIGGGRYVAKYDNTGNVLAVKEYDNSVGSPQIIPTPDGGTIFVLSVSPNLSIDIDGDGQNDQEAVPFGVTNRQIVIKYDNNLNYEYSNQINYYGAPLNFLFGRNQCAFKSNGNAVFFAGVNTAIGTSSGHLVEINKDFKASVAVEISTDGTILSMVAIEGDGEIVISAAITDADDNYIISGYIGSQGNVQMDLTSTDASTEITDCAFLAKLAPDFSLISLRHSMGMELFVFSYIELDDDGILHGLSSVRKTVHLDFDNSPEANTAFINDAPGNSNIWRMVYAKYDENLRAIFGKSIGSGVRHLSSRGMKLTADQNIFIIGKAGPGGEHNMSFGTEDHLQTLATNEPFVARYGACVNGEINATIETCAGESVTLNGGEIVHNVVNGQVITRRTTLASGCDMVRTYIVNVYEPSETSETISVCSGSTYVFPDGSITADITSNLNHTSILTTQQGCDSVVVTGINILATEESEETVMICPGESHEFPDGIVVSNIQSDMIRVSTITGNNGCNAQITTFVNLLETEYSEETVTICNGENFTFPDGETINNITTPMSQVSTITGSNGCDAQIMTQVNLLETEMSEETVAICEGESYTFPDGEVVDNITTPMNRVSSITGTNGCEAFVTTNVEVLETAATIVFESICNGNDYEFPDGAIAIGVTQGFTQISTLIATNGCDSIVTTQLSVFESEDSEETVNLCVGESYSFPDGETINDITSNLTHTSILETEQGCDMEITTNIIVETLDINLNILSGFIQVEESLDNYQWINCTNGMTPIEGETNTTFTPNENGSYSLSTDIEGCIHVSDCIDFIMSSIEENALSRALTIYPNPAHDQVTIDFSQFESDQELQVELRDITGRLIQWQSYNPSNSFGRAQLDLDATAGIYLLTITSGTLQATKQLIIE